MTHTHTFRPWEIRDGQCVRSPDSIWQEPLAWDRSKRCQCEASLDGCLGHLPVCSQHPSNRPLILVDADPFATFDGPVVDSDGILLRPYLDSENTPEYRTPDPAIEDWWDGEWKHHPDPQGWSPVTFSDLVSDLFRLFDATPNCDWLVRTRHPERMSLFIPKSPQGQRRNLTTKCLKA